MEGREGERHTELNEDCGTQYHTVKSRIRGTDIKTECGLTHQCMFRGFLFK